MILTWNMWKPMISMKPHLYPSNDCLLNVAVYVTDYLSRGDNSMKTIDLIYFIKVKSSNIVIKFMKEKKNSIIVVVIVYTVCTYCKSFIIWQIIFLSAITGTVNGFSN